MPSTPRLLAASAVLIAGCPSAEPEATVFWTDVAPLIETHCVECHQDGGVAPFRLDTYEAAAQWAGPSAQAVAARSMPPFLVKDDGSCGEFEDGNWLSEAAIQTFATWAAEGAQEGAGATVALTEPRVLTGDITDTQTPNFVPEIVGGDYAEFDEYRCFMVDIPTQGSTPYLTGYEVLPGNPAIVHHVIGYPVVLDDPSDAFGKTNREVINEMQADEPGRDGWPCFNAAGPNVSTDFEVVAWAPGQGPVEYPQGVGLALPENSVMVYQVHYNLVDPATLGQPDQTTVRLRIEDSVEREAYMSLPDGFLGGFSDPSEIPPGESETSVNFELPLSWLLGNVPLDFEILAVLPHMHARGRQMYVSLAHEDGGNTCVAEVQAWDYNWQRLYMYETPLAFGANDTLMVECVYDTSGDDEPIEPGWGTQNEMCLPGVLVAVKQ
ncbi:MAG: hypothetical protein KDA24_13410 [Deltaproteobacteria bacterium]|nr:hypothetical protein [Deltaproteobacteria bacterium]